MSEYDDDASACLRKELTQKRRRMHISRCSIHSTITPTEKKEREREVPTLPVDHPYSLKFADLSAIVYASFIAKLEDMYCCLQKE